MKTKRFERRLQVLDTGLEILDVYIFPTFVLLFGVAALLVPFYFVIPEAADLTEVHGRVRSYYFYQEGRGVDDYAAVVTLENGYRFWTRVIRKNNAGEILGANGVDVVIYAESHPALLSHDGTNRAWGLWINGREIESLQKALDNEKFDLLFIAPIAGVVFIGAALYLYSRNRLRYFRPKKR